MIRKRQRDGGGTTRNLNANRPSLWPRSRSGGRKIRLAPEVLEKQYGPECDIWSIGVLVFFMLSGAPPFDGESRKEIYRKIRDES